MDIDARIVNYITGNCNAEEAQWVDEWIKKDHQNRTYHDQLLKTWGLASQLKPVSPVDENEAWKRFQHRLKNKEKTSYSFTWIRIAALFILVTGAAIFFFYLKESHTVTPADTLSIMSGGFPRTESLPDGSTVTLEANSSIYYPAVFRENASPVTLRGSAFFRVTSNRTKPFVIRVNDISIQVLGTSFSVRSNRDSTSVDVTSGIVKLIKHNDSALVCEEEKINIPTGDTLPMKNYIIKKIQSEVLLKYLHDRKQELANKNESLSKTANDEEDSAILHDKIELFRLIYEKGGDSVLLKGAALDSLVKGKMSGNKKRIKH